MRGLMGAKRPRRVPHLRRLHDVYNNFIFCYERKDASA